jgi:uncharacterized glyoxalase superfamily metalloenzyme YdcJ
MQNAKDSFYIALRNRLAIINPARVVTLRAVTRPGIMVEDAEAPQPQIPNDIFVLRWTSEAADVQLPLVLIQMTCEIHYASSGSQLNNGLDRGRALTEMDRELLAMLTPSQAQKFNYTQTPAAAMQTFVFWNEPVFSATETRRDQLLRAAKITVFAFEEQGE